MDILVLDISGSESLQTSLKSFFSDRPVHLRIISDFELFKTLSASKRFDLAIALVSRDNNYLLKGKNLIPTLVFQQHNYESKKLRRFYHENGGEDG